MAGAISITDTSEDASDLTTYTFSTQAVGAEASDRHVLVGIGWRESTPTDRSVSSATIGGSAATIWRQDHIADSGTAIIGVDLPTGTTADVAITFNGANSRCLIAVARCTGIDVAAVFSSSGATDDQAGGVTSQAVNLNTPADGIAFGYMFLTDTAATPTLSWAGTDGLTNGTQQLGEANFFHALNGIATTSSQTPRGVTASFSGGGSVLGLAATVVSFSPSAAGGAAARVVGTGLTESRFVRKTRLAKAHDSMVGWRAQRGLLVPDRKLAA
jgi:hypothetical protein